MESMPRTRQWKCVEYVVVVMGQVLVSGHSSVDHAVQMEIRQATESHCTGSMPPQDGLQVACCMVYMNS